MSGERFGPEIQTPLPDLAQNDDLHGFGPVSNTLGQAPIN
jgi:hypothetical protein